MLEPATMISIPHYCHQRTSIVYNSMRAVFVHAADGIMSTQRSLHQSIQENRASCGKQSWVRAVVVSFFLILPMVANHGNWRPITFFIAIDVVVWVLRCLDVATTHSFCCDPCTSRATNSLSEDANNERQNP